MRERPSHSLVHEIVEISTTRTRAKAQKMSMPKIHKNGGRGTHFFKNMS